MVKLTLYGSKMATCTQRVLILLEELELKYDFINIDLMKDEQKNNSFLKMNPFGRVPAVEYDTYNIFESRTILRYISKNNNDYKDLTLDDSVHVDMWLEAESQNMSPVISKIVYEKLFKKWKDPKAVIDEILISKEMDNLRKVLDVYEYRLSNSKYIGGDEFSIADISNIPYIHAFVKCGYKSVLKEFPSTYKWIKKIMLRNSVIQVLEEASNTLNTKLAEEKREAGKDTREHEEHDRDRNERHDRDRNERRKREEREERDEREERRKRDERDERDERFFVERRKEREHKVLRK